MTDSAFRETGPPPPPRPVDWQAVQLGHRHRFGHRMVIGFLAGTIAGFAVLGVGGRVAMTAIALARDMPFDWSLGGTLSVIVLGTAMGPPGGVLYAWVRPRLPASTLLSGLLFGIPFGAVWVAIYFLRPAGPIELHAAPILGAWLFAGVLVGFGVALALTVVWLERHIPHRSNAFVTALVMAVAIGGAALAVAVLMGR